MVPEKPYLPQTASFGAVNVTAKREESRDFLMDPARYEWDQRLYDAVAGYRGLVPKTARSFAGKGLLVGAPIEA